MMVITTEAPGLLLILFMCPFSSRQCKCDGRSATITMTRGA
jgi:hypothetical protein